MVEEMKSLLEQIESRVAVCAKATPGPWEGTMMQAADTGPRLIIVAEDTEDTCPKPYRQEKAIW